MNERPCRFHLRLSDASTVYGPVALETLRQWAREGRIGPGCEVSPDGHQWIAADRIPELGLHWWMKLPDGRWYGPVHLSAAAALATEHGLSSDVAVRRGSNGGEMTLAAALAQTRESPASTPILDEERVLEDLRRALGIRRRI